MNYFTKGALCSFLLLVHSLQFAAQALPLTGNTDITKIRLTISFKAITLKLALDQIKEASVVSFAYNEKEVNVGKNITASFTDTSLKDILDALLLKNGCEYQVLDDVIIVSPAKVKKMDKPVPIQTGSIRGNIYDAQDREALVGANVRIEGTQIGTSADADGNYVIRELEPGRYNLIVSFIGYQPKKLENIEVKAGNEAKVNVALTASSESLSEIVVVGNIDVRYQPVVNSTEISLIENMRQATGIVTGISNQQIANSLDRDAADVMQRVPGVNLLNNFVLIRGLSQRYTMTYINGMMAPSTEEDQRAFSFNLLPSGLIDNIMVYKSPAPELQGGFAGGVVKVSTRQSSAVRRIQVSLSAQYRPGSSFANGYTNSGASGSDWLGSGIKDRMYDDRMYDPNYSWPTGNWYAARDLTLKYPKPYNLEKNKTNFDKSARVNYYDSWKLGSTRLNNLTSLGYTSQSRFVTGRTNGNIIPQNLKEQALEEEPDFYATDSLYNQQVRLSALQTLGLQINDHHRLEFTGLYNRSVDDNSNIRDKEIYPENDTDDIDREVNYEYSVQDLLSAQLSGEHTLGVHQLNWRVGKNYTSQKAPDVQSHQFKGLDSSYTYASYQIRGVNNRVLRRGSFFTEENGTSYGLDYQVKLRDRYLLKAGGMYQTQERTFESWYYFLGWRGDGNNSHALYDLKQPWYHLSDILDDNLVVDPDDVNGDGSTYGMYIGRDFSEGIFTVDNSYSAGYLGAEIPILNKKLQVNAGFRYEAYERRLFDQEDRELITTGGYDWETSRPLGDTIRQGPERTYWLPSTSINWHVRDNMKLTASYGKTVDRPAYRETAPYSYYDFENNSIIRGDAGLRDATIHNYDLRWEYYPAKGEFIAFGIFYKGMKNIIELSDRTNITYESGYRYLYYENLPEATVKGVEVEVRKNLGFIPWRPLQYFSVIANYSMTQNETKVLRKDEENEGKIPGDGKPRPFVGGAPYVLNASLYFEHPAWGTNFSVLINSIGQRMIASPGPRVSPIYELGRTTVDLVYKQRITPFLTLKAGVQNLLNTKILQYRDQNMDGHFDERKVQEVNYHGWDTRYGADYITRDYKIGSYYSIGLTLEF